MGVAPPSVNTHTHTHWTLPTTMSVLETPFDIHVSSVYQTHTCMQAPIPTLCISAKKTHNKGSRTQPIMSTLMPRSGIPVICSRATLSCDSSYSIITLSVAMTPVVGFGKISNSSKLSCMSSLPASMKLILSRTTEKKWQHRFTHYKSMGIFSDAQGQLTPQSVVRSGRISNSSELSCMSSLPAIMKRIG